MEKEVASFECLSSIIDVLMMGPDLPLDRLDMLRGLIDIHADLYRDVYDTATAVKPKFHHLGHIADDIERMGVHLSCWVLERKHRRIKSVSLFVFRNLESTCLLNCINDQVGAISEEGFFDSYYLVGGRHVSLNGMRLHISPTVRTPIGDLKQGDMLLTSTGDVMRLQMCFHSCDSIVVRGDLYSMVDGNPLYRSIVSTTMKFVEVSSIIDGLMWMPLRPGVIRIRLPRNL
jgi:hypothetical protein